VKGTWCLSQAAKSKSLSATQPHCLCYFQLKYSNSLKIKIQGLPSSQFINYFTFSLTQQTAAYMLSQLPQDAFFKVLEDL